MNTMPDKSKLTSPREVFEHLHQFVLAYDADNQAELFSEDAVWEFPFAPEGIPQRIEGREKNRAVVKMGMERSRQSGRRLIGYHSVALHETSDPEVIIVEFEWRGEIAASNQVYKVSYIQVITVHNGLITSLRDYFPEEILKRALA